MNCNGVQKPFKAWRCSPGFLIRSSVRVAIPFTLGAAFIGFGIGVLLDSGAGQGVAVVFMLLGALAIALSLYGGVRVLYLARIRVAAEPDRIVLTCVRNIRFPIAHMITLTPDEVAAVEVRQEVMRYVARGLVQFILYEVGELTTKQGDRLMFAHVNYGALPVAEIAATIAKIAGVALVDKGATPIGRAIGHHWEGRRVTPDELYGPPR